MKKLLSKKSRIWVLSITFILVLVTAILAFQVKTNYDLSSYLPADSNTSEAMDILETTFGNHSGILLAVENLSVDELLDLKASIKAVDHVYSVIWLDDYVDLETTPIEYIPVDVISNFYVNGIAKFTIEFDLGVYDEAMGQVIDTIKALTTEKLYMSGDVINQIEARSVASKQLFQIMLIIVPICLLIMIFASSSWVESLLMLVVLGIAIVLNLGTNYFLGEVSFITKTMAMALQLAMSLDYALFMIHRYHEYEDLDKKEAIHLAFKKSLPSITASSLTTIFGFLALMFMQYRIGFDMGLVLSKGILLSYLSTIILLPIGLYYCADLMKRFKHRRYMPTFTKLSHFIYKGRYILLSLWVLLAVFGFTYQQQSDYLYLGTSGATTAQLENDNFIIDTFGEYNPIIILVKSDSVADEVELANLLASLDHVTSVSSLVTTVDPNIPREFLPAEVVANFVRGGYTRFIINTDLNGESSDYYLLDESVRTTTDNLFDEAYYIGVIPSASDIKTMVQADTLIVLILSIGLVALVIGLVFKSVLVPILLVLMIESSIWINLSINVLNGTSIIYIGYLIIMSIQLGATIDYAVLMTSRYEEELLTYKPKDALQKAIRTSLPAIVVSATILTAAGIIEALVSDMQAIQDIGYMLGRGTAISFLFTLFLLPPLLYVLTRFITKKKATN